MTATRPRAALDTVQAAESSPEQSQPYAELGLAQDEYARIKDILETGFSPLPGPCPPFTRIPVPSQTASTSTMTSAMP